MRAALLLLAFVATAAPQPDWFAELRALVSKGDGAAIAKQARFPMNWENGPIREIKDAEEFQHNFDKYFTPEIRKIIATRTPDKQHTITWKARGNEYSIYFKAAGSGFVLDGLSEGPP